MVKTKALQLGWSILSKNSELTTLEKVFYSPALRPLGGSLVTLIDLYKSPRGNPSLGSHDNQILKSGLAFLIQSSSTNLLSRFCMYLIPKWQFWSRTQFPFNTAVCITDSALDSCPSPNDTLNNVFHFLLANSSIDCVGSAPADSKNNTGVLGLLSSSILSMVSVTGSMYF